MAPGCSERGLLSGCGVQVSDCGGLSVAEHVLWGVRASVVAA